MPLYEYACDPCETIFKAMHGINAPRPETCPQCITIFKAMHGINAPRPETCPQCKGGLRKVMSAPSLNTKRFTSPTEAKYSKLSESDEIKRETAMQKVYQSIWIPEEVKHSPWDDH